jgi:hypothetical protein
MFGLFEKKCEICGAGDITTFIVYQLTKRTKIPFSLTNPHEGIKVMKDLGGYDIAFSDTNKSRPEGNMYLYETGSDLGHHNFCSLKCGFEFSKKTNTLVLYQDPENMKQLRGITPDIIEINIGLGNPESTKYRGQPAGNIN